MSTPDTALQPSSEPLDALASAFHKAITTRLPFHLSKRQQTFIVGAFREVMASQPSADSGRVGDEVTDEIVEHVQYSLHNHPDNRSYAEQVSAASVREALEAVWPKTPALAALGQVERVVAWMTPGGRVINTETRERVLADAELGGEYVPAAKAAESYCIPLYTHPAPAASPAGVPDGWRNTLLSVLGALDRATDTDPNLDPDLTDEDMRGEYPAIWAMQQISALLAAAPSAPEGDGGEG